jgi:hypothetical protein
VWAFRAGGTKAVHRIVSVGLVGANSTGDRRRIGGLFEAAGAGFMPTVQVSENRLLNRRIAGMSSFFLPA